MDKIILILIKWLIQSNKLIILIIIITIIIITIITIITIVIINKIW
jgi:hypothetical protein